VMYAMCNLHDVTWGTKGDNGAAKDLGGAKKVKDADGKELLEVELPTAREDVDSMWAASRSSLRQPPPQEKEHRDAATKLADHDRNSRTNVVLAWVGTNMLMIVFFTVCLSLQFSSAMLTIVLLSSQLRSRTGSVTMLPPKQMPPSTPTWHYCSFRWLEFLPFAS
jgi:hypothetical protein